MQFTNFIGYLFVFVQLSLFRTGYSAQCKKRPTRQNGKLNFEPLNGEMQPSSLPTEYDAKGLQPLFNLGSSFMNTVQSKKISKELEGMKLDKISESENREKLIKYETPVIIAAGFGVLFIVFMPIIGLCFCCCRCCGKCGGKNYQHHKAAEKHSACVIMTAILFIVAVLMLCGCMFMFVTNSRTHDTAQNLGPTYVNAVDSVISVANSTKNTLVAMSNDFVPCLIDVVKDELGNNGINLHFGNPIRDFIKGNLTTPLSTAAAISTTVDDVMTNLEDIKSKSESLETDGTSLEAELKLIRTDLQNAKTSCGAGAECDKISEFEAKVKMDVDFNELPSIQSSIDKIKEVQDLNISKNVAEATKVIDDIPQTVISKTSSSIDDVIKTVNDLQAKVEKQVNDVADNLDSSITKEKDKWMSYKKYVAKDSENFKYENYRYWAYIGLSGLMAFIVFLLFGGLILGACGYSRDASPAQRSKTATCGGNCLMASVGFMFIFSFFLMLFCTIWFAVGIQLHLGCRDLKDASIFDNLLSDQLNLKLEEGKERVSVSGTLAGCRENKPLFQSLGGNTVYNLSGKFNIREMINIDSVLDKVDFSLTDQTVVTQEMKDALEKLKSSDVNNINFTAFFATLEQSITQYNLTELAKNVTDIADKLSAGQKVTSDQLKAVAQKLRDVDAKTIPSIQGKARALKPVVEKLQQLVANLKDKANLLLTELLASENFIQVKTTPEILKLITSFTTLILDYVLQGTDFIINQALTKLLRCKPVSDLYDGLLGTLLCDEVVQNANGFWLALGWCLLFFIPAIIFSVRLAKYYRKMEYDSGMDQTFENPPYNDKIPLKTYGVVEGHNVDRHSTVLSKDTSADRGMLMADDLQYDHHAPPPYQQHQNQGYANH